MSRLDDFVEAAVDRLELILVAGGYNTNAGQRVYRARASIAESEVPCIVVWVGEESGPGATSGRSWTVRTELLIDGFVAANQSNTGQQLELLRADIKRALCTDDRFSDPAGGNAGAVIGYLGSKGSERVDGATYEGVTCRFALTYTEKKGDPDAS